MTNEIIDDSSVVTKINNLLIDAIQKRASDIHLEPTNSELRVRYRIDGILLNQRSFTAELSNSIIARFKILASLNSTERRIPQDGKFRFVYKNNETDIRLSTFPALYGEKIVIRILDRNLQAIELNSLGLELNILKMFQQLLSRQSGFFLVTGPTGSGKTTTLYAALSFLHNSEKNIVTLEDPIEYSLDGITQAQINPLTGFTFEKGIRSLVRQDPDIIMVGEIRDKITARIAIEAALTGHLVLSTLHTSDAPSALMRLLDMGIEPFLLNAALSGVLAQRLLRKLCSNCKIKRNLTCEEKEILKEISIDTDIICEPKGCSHCNELGYKGRIGIFELLKVSSALRVLVMQKADCDDIYTQVIKDGMKTLQEDAAHKFKEGIVSLTDFMRII